MISDIYQLADRIESWAKLPENGEDEDTAEAFMNLAFKLRNREVLDQYDVKECLDFLKANGGSAKMIEMFEHCLKEGGECRIKM